MKLGADKTSGILTAYARSPAQKLAVSANTKANKNAYPTGPPKDAQTRDGPEEARKGGPAWHTPR